MKKLLVFIITSIAIIAIFLTLLPPSNTLTTLLTLNSCSDVKAIRLPSLYQDGEHSLKNGNIDEALKTITKGKAVQPSNAPSPMLVTLFGMVTLVKPLQYWNASSPMLVTEEIITL